MSTKKAEDVVILGGGVLGFSAAYHLAKQGIASQVIEMDSVGAKASGKADGMIPDAVSAFFYAGSSHCPGGHKPSILPLMAEGYHTLQKLHLELKEETGMDIQHGNCQMLTCALSEQEEETLAHIASDGRKAGLDVEWLSGDEARALENTLTEEVRGAVLTEYSQVEPYRYTLALAQGAENRGASIRYAQSVGFHRQDNRVTSVILSKGEKIPAGTVVITMGPWSGQAVSWLGARLPLGAIRAQTLKMESSKRPTYQLGFMPPSEHEWPHVFMLVSPRVDGTLFVGYTEDRPETWDDSRPETWTDMPSEDMKELMIDHALRFVPVLEDGVLVEHRSALLGHPPGEGMIIGPIPGWDNVYMAAIGDNGIVISPAVGRIMTSLVIGGDRAKRAIKEVDPLDPSRFIL